VSNDTPYLLNSQQFFLKEENDFITKSKPQAIHLFKKTDGWLIPETGYHAFVYHPKLFIISQKLSEKASPMPHTSGHLSRLQQNHYITDASDRNVTGAW